MKVGQRVVFYANHSLVTALDILRKQPSHSINSLGEGEEVAGVIVRVWGDSPESCVNLKLQIDGTTVDYWVTSVKLDQTGERTPGTFALMGT